MSRLRRIWPRMAVGMVGMVLLLALTTGNAFASSAPARTEMAAAGPYIIEMGISQDPPYVDQPLLVTVVPQKAGLHLTGKVIVEPGSGTDATNIPTPLTATNDSKGSLEATVRMPVQGAWNIVVQLDGPQGSGQATLATTVGAPGAMAPWLAWLIGSSPLLLVAFWVWYQHRYRRTLVKQQAQPA